MFFRWTMRLNEYDFDVLHKAGKDNGDADIILHPHTILEWDEAER